MKKKKLLSITLLSLTLLCVGCNNKKDSENQLQMQDPVNTDTSYQVSVEVTPAVIPVTDENSDNNNTVSSTESETITSTEPQATEDDRKHLSFKTTDLAINVVTSEEMFADAKVIMVNFWEPWCGPCVGEMPSLEKLYESYKDNGLLIIGVYTADNSSTKKIVEKHQITYPIIRGNKALAEFSSDYVPTTVFFDSEGYLLSEDQIIGSLSYGEWEAEIKKYLELD